MTTRNVLDVDDVLTVYDPLSVAESSSCKGDVVRAKRRQ